MKNTASRVWKSCVSMALVLCMVLSLPLNVLAAAKVPSTADKATVNAFDKDTSMDVNGDGKVTYVSLGDSVTNGYGLPGYRYEDGTNPYGFYRDVEGAYPDLVRDALVAQGYEVDLRQMAVSGYRMDEVHGMLDDDFVGDSYHVNHFRNWNTHMVEAMVSKPDDYQDFLTKLHAYEAANGVVFGQAGEVGDRKIADEVMKLEYREAVSQADLITISLGTNNVGTFLTMTMRKELGMGDPNDFDIDFATYMDPESAATMEKVLRQTIAGVLGSEENPLFELAYSMIECLLYGYLGFTEHYDATIETIYEMNPDAKIVVVDMYAMISGIDMVTEKLGSAMDIDGLYNLIVDCINLYTRELSPYATKVTHVTLPQDPELCIDYFADYSENMAADLYADTQYLHPVAETLMNELVMEMLGYDVDVPGSREQFENEMLKKIEELDETVNDVQATVETDVIKEEVEPGIKDGVKLIYDALRVPEAIKGYRLISMGLDKNLSEEERKAAIIAGLVQNLDGDEALAETAYTVAVAYFAEMEESGDTDKAMIAAYATQLNGDEAAAAAANQALKVYDAVYDETGKKKTAATAALADFLRSSNNQLTEEDASDIAAAMHAVYDGDATPEQHKLACVYALTTEQLKDNAQSGSRKITQEEATAIYTCYEGGMNGKFQEKTVYDCLTVLMVLDGRFDYLDEAKSNYDMYLVYKRLPATLEKIANCRVMYMETLMEASEGSNDSMDMVSGMKEKILNGTLRLEEPKAEDFETEEAYQEALAEYKHDATLSILFFRFFSQDGVFTHPSLAGQKYMYDQIAAALQNLHEAEEDSDIQVTADSKLLVLGDFIATNEGYVNQVAKNLNLKPENVTNLSGDKFRINELRALLDSSYARDAYAQHVLADVTDDYVAAVQDHDLIVVHLGSMNMGLITEQLFSYLATKTTYSMKYAPIANMAVRNLGTRVDKLMGAFEGGFTGEDADVMSGAMMLIFKTYGYGYTTFADCLDNTIETIQKLNPNANIVLVGQYDLLGNFNMSQIPGASDMKMAFGSFVDHAQKLMNKHMEVYAEMTDNVVYVDIYRNSETSANLMTPTAFTGSKPNAEFYKEIGGKISCALTAHTPENAEAVTWGDWTEDNTKTAAFTCKYCAQAVETAAVITSVRDAYCDKEGTLTYTASVADVICPDTKVVAVPKTGHTPGEAVKEKEVASTCTKAGSYEEVVYCSVCDKELSRVEKSVDLLGHNLTEVKAVDTTCDSSGTKAHFKCGTCGKLFADKDGKTEVTAESLKVPGSHKLTEVKAVEATCVSGGTKAHYKCDICGKLFADKDGKTEVTAESLAVAGGHKITAVAEVAPTCDTNGTRAHFKCETCGKLFADPAGTTEVTAAALATPSKGGHTPQIVPGKAATCTEKGLSDGSKCSVCGLVLKEQKELIPKGHTYKDGVCAVCKAEEPVDPAKGVVIRTYGDNRYETSMKVADELKKTLKVEKFDTVIVASGTSFADALAGSCLAAQKSAPILVTNKHNHTKIQAYILKNLAAKGTVYILGGESAVSADFEKGLAGNQYTITRLAGEDRYETNLKILKESGVKAGDTILVCTGKSFADSLSASATGLPILLVRGDHKLFMGQNLFLKNLGTENKFIIIGGTNAVSTKLEAELKAYGTTQRIGGINRFETSTLLAKTFFDKPESAVLAYAKKFPDGLCGGPLAYALKAPLILTQTGKEAQAASYTKAMGIRNGYVLGGTGLISDEAALNVFENATIK